MLETSVAASTVLDASINFSLSLVSLCSDSLSELPVVVESMFPKSYPSVSGEKRESAGLSSIRCDQLAQENGEEEIVRSEEMLHYKLNYPLR